MVSVDNIYKRYLIKFKRTPYNDRAKRLGIMRTMTELNRYKRQGIEYIPTTRGLSEVRITG